jgi:AMP-polyphosphate phosphotransferase
LALGHGFAGATLASAAEFGALSIDLSEYEAGKAFDGDDAVERSLLRGRLAYLQALHIAHGCRTLIVIEGWESPGQSTQVQTLSQNFDPRFTQSWVNAEPHGEEKERHFLWRFWQKLPRYGQIALFDGSHYHRVLNDSVTGIIAEADVRRGFDEINEFEAQQRDSGTRLIKIFLHLTPQQYRATLTERMHDSARRWTVSAEQLHRLSVYDGYRAALNDMFGQTDTRWAPWHVIDANDVAGAEIALLRKVADEMATYVPTEFPDIGAEAAALADVVLPGGG